jgi:glycosyltransferase involved in cell wall biosynthesis
MGENPMTWHVLDATSIWIKEFCAALGKTQPVCAWVPTMASTGIWQNWEKTEVCPDPLIELRKFPLQRGYARFPVSLAVRLGPTMVGRLERQMFGPVEESPLICTTPYYAPVAERWPGPVIYYQTDLTVEYHNVDRGLIRSLDRRMCAAADLVCPNSHRIAAYMESVGCDPGKIRIVPNATRELNLAEAAPLEPSRLPENAVDMIRPVAGVIGNLAANMDWIFLRDLVERTPEFSWLFVGPTTMEVPDPGHRAARETLLQKGGRVRFVGPQPYGALQAYARGIDVAVLPYRKKEPTYSGSSTRFYEHLSACRPMLATRGFEELLHKEPLLTLCNHAEEGAALLSDLRHMNFRDGQEEARWQASRSGTWEVRAAAMVAALHDGLDRGNVVRPPFTTLFRPLTS